MSREDIQRHREAGTCFLCSQPVVDGQPVHGPTGAHWDCSEKLNREVAEMTNRVTQPPLLCVRACGGVISHWVDPDTHEALCGAKPKNDPKSSMPGRGKWLKYRDQDPATKKKMCLTCSEKKAVSDA